MGTANFFPPKILFFCDYYLCATFQNRSTPPSSRKVCVGGWWVCKPILVFRFGPKALDLDLDQAEQNIEQTDPDIPFQNL